ncbi:MAG: microviridin/marinostatin family tricyclic proteinase inhibitor [Nostochopsis sp.]
MSNNTNKVVPFFARFLEEQLEQSNESSSKKGKYPTTLKYPSDWEEY